MSEEVRTPEITQPVRDVLAAHFVMWHDLPPGLGTFARPRGEWRCSCGLKFGFSDTALDHVTEQIGDVHERGFEAGHEQAMADTAALVEAAQREFGTLGWNACATAIRALIAAGTGDTVSVFDLESMLTAGEDEEADGA